MFIDAREIKKNKIIDADICIVGAGAAGITIARNLIGSSLKVVLLESGGLELDNKTQSLNEGENVGHPYPLSSWRLRYFGGTTGHWAGSCRPLDPIDFTVRDWVPHSGWPIDRATLNPYYEQAHRVLQLGPFDYSLERWAEKRPPLGFYDDVIRTVIFQGSPPTRFNIVYRDELKKANNIDTYLYANVAKFKANESGQRVETVHVNCINGNEFHVRAKTFVLATGGIENARLLLLSNDVHASGLGNQNDLVGRFFMEHPFVTKSALMALEEERVDTQLYRVHEVKNTAYRIKGILSPSDEIQKKEKLLQCGFYVNRGGSFSIISSGVRSAMKIKDALKEWRLPEDVFGEIGNMITHIDDLSRATYSRLANERMVHFNYFAEQVPNPDSRVTLSREKDPFGLNRVKLDWKFAQADIDNLEKVHNMLAREAGRSGVGRVWFDFDKSETQWSFNGSAHHMGTTRMHDDEKQGVVDKNNRIHGVDNLFVAGSSVFPTGGFSNPTLTIVALALRLSEHIKKITSVS